MSHKYCTSCGKISINTMRICPSCGNRTFSITAPVANANTLIQIKPAISNTATKQPLTLPKASLWNRIWARSIDLVFAMIFGTLAIAVLPESNFFENQTANVIIDMVWSSIIMCILITLYDTVFLTTIGTTIGKKLMGLKVIDANGSLLSFSVAQQRSWLMLFNGLWLMAYFPYLQFVSLIFILKKGSLKWDNGNFGYVIQEPISSTRRISIIIFSLILIFSLMLGILVLREVLRVLGK